MRAEVAQGDAILAFYAALGAVEGVAKTETADAGKYTIRYASLNAVSAECSRACALFDLAITQEPTMVDGMFAVVTTLIHRGGDTLTFEPMCMPMPRDAQAVGSATTYLKRYSLVSIFKLAVEDDDGHAATVSAQTQPGRRTEAERLIRESMAQMDEATRREFTADFQHEFRTALKDLPANRHGDALKWSKDWAKDRVMSTDEAGPVGEALDDAEALQAQQAATSSSAPAGSGGLPGLAEVDRENSEHNYG